MWYTWKEYIYEVDDMWTPLNVLNTLNMFRLGLQELYEYVGLVYIFKWFIC